MLANRVALGVAKEANKPIAATSQAPTSGITIVIEVRAMAETHLLA